MQETAESSTPYWQYKESLIYDAEQAKLLARYGNQMAAYRARKEWSVILDAFFLLEAERDFSLELRENAASREYMLECNFVSACGRYAFWRLINQQAPEAEKKLRAALKTRGTRRLLPKSRGSKTESAIFQSIEHQTSRNQETIGLLERLKLLFTD